MAGEVCIKNGNGTKRIAPIWVIALAGLIWTILTAAITMSANYSTTKNKVANLERRVDNLESIKTTVAKIATDVEWIKGEIKGR